MDADEVAVPDWGCCDVVPCEPVVPWEPVVLCEPVVPWELASGISSGTAGLRERGAGADRKGG